MQRKTTRTRSTQAKNDKRTFDAFPDKIDLRDWPYQPLLAYFSCHDTA